MPARASFLFTVKLFLATIFLTSGIVISAQDRADKSQNTAAAKRVDAIAKDLGLSSKTGSLPAWEKPTTKALNDLSEQFRSLNTSVFLIGNSSNGYGTGFVISKKHRLIATNAHVADIRHPSGELYAIGNNSSHVFEIDNVWYHPGVFRFHQTGSFIRTSDPAQGKVYVVGPDVAVLHVAGTDELPDELQLATANEAKDLFAKAIGMIGFPGHDTQSWPKNGEKPQVTAREGIIARATNFENNGNANENEKQFLQHTMASWFGFSGSPMFLANGHVVALNNSGRTDKKGESTASLHFGVRVDCLWELLAYHKLSDKVSIPVPEKELRLARFDKEDPLLTRLKEVMDLVASGDTSIKEGKYDEAEETLAKAIKLMPNYADAHARMGTRHNNFAINVIWESLNSGSDKYTWEQYKSQMEMALKESQTAMNLDPTNVDYLLDAAREKCGVYFADKDFDSAKDIEEAKIIAKKVLEIGGISHEQRAYAWQLYGQAHAKEADRITYYLRAMEEAPNLSTFPGDLARSYRNLKQEDLAKHYSEKADKLTQAGDQEYSVWEMATSPDESKRDGKEAFRLAKEACEASNYNHAPYLENLAAACAELGKFDLAQHWQAKAFHITPEESKSALRKRLKLYLDNKPFREEAE